MANFLSAFNSIRYVLFHGYTAWTIFLPFIKLLAHSLPRKRWKKESLRREEDLSPWYELKVVAESFFFLKKIFFQLGFIKTLMFLSKTYEHVGKGLASITDIHYVKPQVLR